MKSCTPIRRDYPDNKVGLMRIHEKSDPNESWSVKSDFIPVQSFLCSFVNFLCVDCFFFLSALTCWRGYQLFASRADHACLPSFNNWVCCSWGHQWERRSGPPWWVRQHSDDLTRVFCPIVPTKFRKDILHLHYISHPRRLATWRLVFLLDLIGMGSPTTSPPGRDPACTANRAKSTAKHVLPQPIPISQRWFAHLHINLVGPYSIVIIVFHHHWSYI
jgi:hypothetical protein